MSFMRSVRTAPADTPATADTCDACHTVVAGLTRTTVQGVALMLCPHPVACRQRAQAKGVWLS